MTAQSWTQNKVSKPRSSEKALEAESVTLCWISGASGAKAPRLCVSVSNKQGGLHKSANYLLQTSLELVQNPPAWEHVRQPKFCKNRQTLEELRKRASCAVGKQDFLNADMTAEGAVGDIHAVGVGPNKELKERAFWLAMSATILLQHPEECSTICDDAAKHLVQEALHFLKQWAPIEVPASSFYINNQCFFMVSDQVVAKWPDQTFAKNWKENVNKMQDYLKKQTSLLIDFQVGGETTFAVLKPTEWLEWGQAWVRWAKQGPAIYCHDGEEITPKSNFAIILDMRDKACIDLLRQLLADENILKVCWAFKENMKAFLGRHLMEYVSSKLEAAIQNVLDIENVFCHDGGQNESLAECLDRLGTAKAKPYSTQILKSQVGIVLQPFADSFKDAACNVLAMEALIALGTPGCCSYNAAWMKTLATIHEVCDHFKRPRELAKMAGNLTERCETAVSKGFVKPAVSTSKADDEEAGFKQMHGKDTLQYKAKPPSSEAQPGPCFHLNGHRFIIVSEQPDFVQGRFTIPESYKATGSHLDQDALQNYRAFVADVQSYLMSQKSLLVDFQGEMMGHAGEIYFAVISPALASNLATTERYDCELTGTELLDGRLDSAASTIDTVTATRIPKSVAECAGFILDMRSQANVEVIQELLASPTICKMCWDCKGTLQNMICQKHIVATQVQNVVDAQHMFSSNEENLSSLSRMIEDARNEMQQPGLKPECQKSSKGTVKNETALCCDWTEEDWGRLQALLQPPDWDRYHAYNERAMRRPFPQSFLKHGAAAVLGMQVVVAQDQHRWCSDNKALKLVDDVISALRNDPHGIQSLQELRTQFLKHPSPSSNQARAIAMRYCHHFAAVRGVGDAGSESLEHKELLDRLTWIDLKMPECDRLCFRSDPVHELLCKVVRNLQLTTEDRSNFKRQTAVFFPDGVTICRSMNFSLLTTWADQLQETSDYVLKQDEETFFVELVPDGPDEPEGNSAQLPFLHLQFVPSANKIRGSGPGAWWGLSKDDWNSPGAETKKRLLQAIAWIFFGQSQSAQKLWTRFHGDWAILACDIQKLNLGPTTRLKSLYFLDSQRMVFKRKTPDCLAPLDAGSSSWHIPQRRVVENVETSFGNPKGDWSDPSCGQLTLCFTCKQLHEPQLAKKISYDSVRQQIEEQARQFGLSAYIVEFPSVGGYARFKRRTWEVFKESVESFKSMNFLAINLRFRQVWVRFTGSCMRLEDSPLYQAPVYMEDLQPRETFPRIQSMVRSELERTNLGHCLWGSVDGNPVVKELTADNTAEFIRSCWTDSADDIVLAIHFQEVFVWFDSDRYPLQLPNRTEAEVFESIRSLMKTMSVSHKMFFYVGTTAVEFDRKNIGLLLETTSFNAQLGPLNFELSRAWR